jgi:RNA polymerase sigma-70 factor (ECF subfamily)
MTRSPLLTAADFTDLELRDRMLARDGIAWREFHRRYDRLVFRCIHKVVGRFRSVVGSEDVREIHAQLLVNLTTRDMHRLRAFEPERGNKLGSWIGMLATNTAWDYLRHISRRPENDERLAIEAAPQPSPEDELAKRQMLGIVGEVLAELSEKDQDFVRMYFVEGLDPEEIADEMGISVKTVYSKKHKIRCRLESMLVKRRGLDATA